MISFIDMDIAHVRRVMLPALAGDLGGPILPAEYWRERLNGLLDVPRLTVAQVGAVESLLHDLDEYEAAHTT